MFFHNLKRILDFPILYLTYRAIVGGQRATSIYVNEYVRPKNRDRVLDIGCGRANIISFLQRKQLRPGRRGDLPGRPIHTAGKSEVAEPPSGRCCLHC